jgi:NAD(P)H-flavin reductase
MLTYTTTLTRKTKLNNSTYLFHFHLLEGQKIEFVPGQYVMMQVGDKTRLYSIASSNKATDSFELLIELVDGGLGSEYLRTLQEGTPISFRGPAGFFTIRDLSKPLVFIATGTGIAPMRSMLSSSPAGYPYPIRLLWGIKYQKDLYLIDELNQLKGQLKDFEYSICLSREENVGSSDKLICHKGHVTDYIEILSDDIRNNGHFYICGGRKMVEDVNNRLLSLGVEKERVFFEKY